METANLKVIILMLQLQLREEEANYQLSLKNNKEFWELKMIKQRIKSLQYTINSIIELSSSFANT